MEKPRLRRVVPLHRSTGTGAGIASLLGRQTFDLPQSDFVAVVDERNTRHGQNHGEGQEHLARRPSNGETGRVMIAARNGDKAEIARDLVVMEIRIYKIADVTFTRGIEEAVSILGERIEIPRPFAPEERVVSRGGCRRRA